MSSFGLLLMLIGIFIIINAKQFRDVLFGDVQFNFINPKSA